MHGIFSFALDPAGSSDTLIKALPHESVVLLLAQLAALLFVARLLGELARKIGQPPVVGELMAGVLLGPSVFGAITPELQIGLFPLDQHQSDLLAVVAWMGVLFLLIVTGLETDIGLIQRRGKAALTPGGALVTVSAPPRLKPKDGRAAFFVVEPDRAQLAALAQRLRDGRLTPIVGAVRTLDEAPGAFAAAQRTPGKTIIRVVEDE